MTKENKLNAVFTWFLIGAAFLLPIFFLPLIANPLVNSKLLLIFLVSFVSAFAFVTYSLQKKTWEIIRTPFTFPLLVFALLVIVSSFVSHQYPAKQFLGLGGAYLGFAAVTLFAPTLLKAKYSHYFSLAVNTAAIILSVLSIAQLFGFGLAPLINQLSILDLPNTLAFSLSGATFVTIQFLSTVLLSNFLDRQNWQKSWFNKIVIIVTAVALGINVWAVLPKNPAAFQVLSLANSASIARSSLAFTRNALFGYGPDSYGNAYNILKPTNINGFSYWQFTFDSAFNFLLTMIVSTGFLAFLAYLAFLIKIVVSIKNSNKEETFLKSFVAVALAWQLFAPVNLVMLFLLAIALAFFTLVNREQYHKTSFVVNHLTDFLHQGKWLKTKNIGFMLGNCLFGLFLVFALYAVSRNFLAYFLLYRSSASLSQNKVAEAYGYHKDAKSLASQIDFVRRSYSSLNLQIAIALSNKADTSTAEQEQVLQLVNQAISEAKAATILDPTNYQNWSSLAQIYLQLIKTTDQAQQEAFNALAKAATYNPNNPELRIALGQLFLNKQQYAEAIVFFDQAVERKPDLFIAHYYLAQALAANGQLTEAKSALANSLSLLKKESEEYQIVEQELNQLVKQIEGNHTDETKNNELNDEPTLFNEASGSAEMQFNQLNKQAAANSNLSNLLDKQDAEAAIQDNALRTDQGLIGN